MLQVWPEAVPAGFKPPSLLKVDHALIALRAFGQEPAQATGQGAGGQLPLHTYFDAAQVLITRAAPGNWRRSCSRIPANPPRGAWRLPSPHRSRRRVCV